MRQFVQWTAYSVSIYVPIIEQQELPMSKAWTEGYKAQTNGKRASVNPYNDRRKRLSWFDGFAKAELEEFSPIGMPGSIDDPNANDYR